MASISRRLLLQSRQCPSRIRSQLSPSFAAQWQRPVSTTRRQCAKKDTEEGSATVADAKAPAEIEYVAAAPSYSNRPVSKTKSHKHMSKEEKEATILSSIKDSLSALDPEVVEDAVRKGKQGIPFAKDFELENDEHWDIEEDDKRKVATGFWAEGEESMGTDEDYFGDDVTSHGHGQLQEHRELREYARLIAWELPLLSQLARPFEPPTESTPFRFRYTSYLGESHPAANKVVVEFCANDLPLTAQQVSKLIKLAGPRYNPSTSIIKLSCEQFDTQAQNKRFLGETIASLVKEAKDGKDSFEDVPFDFRHHKPKPRFEFPKEWALTQQRKQYLEDKRQKVAQIEDERLHNGNLIDGKTVIETSLPFIEQAQAEPVMVGGPRGKARR
ncbi:uncharacterized protein K460DRAFT_285978 [Cucurbitaria berberidis CBS 394.84]|uniref:Small ribosomal subunit protein mS35 mitochondrial conserved domain-containing protein n=1 Tax=Cucurbitaria berberidis CBS 394.84 TaxID=1168544 RepID=A0A9P4GHA0_9PLEO|nr:uncharacterized protein K460DRAFT_285978 [Cucurbitaria berberidis CBS 394.84]KAF1845201.1 hypothetical protein K460DRAFT_285978 [Cucurbitaria berberidis CBS 394.84]